MKKFLVVFLVFACAQWCFAAETPTVKGRVLLVASSTDSLELKDHRVVPTGYFLDELAVPAQALIAAGYEVIVATPGGKTPVMDQHSNTVALFQNNQAALDKALNFINTYPSMLNPITIQQAVKDGLENFDAVYVPGGHAPINDLMQDKAFGDVLRHFHATGKPTGLLCHGPIALIAALDNPSEFRKAMVDEDFDAQKKYGAGWQYAGYHMTIYSNAEEYSVERYILEGKMPFYVADALQVAGGIVESGPLDQTYVVRDRELITGQNPASDHAIAEKLIEALQEKR